MERPQKGVKQYVIKKYIKHEDYRNTLANKTQMHHKMNTLRSVKHVIGSYRLCKVSLSSFDDKRYLREKGIASYAYGHRRITAKVGDRPQQ